MITTSDYTASDSWKAIIAKWSLNQGLPTVILFAIGIGLYHMMNVGLPSALDTIEAGYERNAKDLSQVATTQKETVQLVLQQWREDRDILLELCAGHPESAKAAAAASREMRNKEIQN